jgi:hypothetical protein
MIGPCLEIYVSALGQARCHALLVQHYVRDAQGATADECWLCDPAYATRVPMCYGYVSTYVSPLAVFSTLHLFTSSMGQANTLYLVYRWKRRITRQLLAR